MEQLLETMLAKQASDLHVQSGATPALRIAAEMRDVKCPPLSAEEVWAFIDQILTPVSRRDLQRHGSCDLAFSYGPARLRVNVYVQQGLPVLAIRRLSLTIPTFGQLNLPSAVEKIADSVRGLVLVAGTTSSGKSTTIAAMIGHINRTRKRRIITIEDPIEYVHTSERSLVSQIEIGSDTPSYEHAIRQVLRQDPNVIMVGELRDVEGIRVALRAADTGHLVFATVHAADARQTVERIIAMFDPAMHDLLLTQLALNIQAVIALRLAKATKSSGGGVVPAVEILRGTPVVRKCIQEQRYEGILQAMFNRDNGMQTFDLALSDLYHAKRISGTEAIRLSTNPEALAMMLRGISTRDTSRGLVR